MKSKKLEKWEKDGLAWWNSKTAENRYQMLRSLEAAGVEPIPAECYARFCKPRPRP